MVKGQDLGNFTGYTPIDNELRAGDVLGLVRGEKQSCISYVPGIAHLFHGALLIADFDHFLHISTCIGLFEGLNYHRCVHQARQDSVDTDIFLGVFQGDALRQLENGCLCGTVGYVWNSQIANAGNGGYVDDCASTLLFHVRQDMFACQKLALEVDCNNSIPAFFTCIHWPTDLNNAHIVMQYIDPAIDVDASLHPGFDFI